MLDLAMTRNIVAFRERRGLVFLIYPEKSDLTDVRNFHIHSTGERWEFALKMELH